MVNKIAIIGGGPAGLSAAIYNARASLEPILFAGSPPGGQLMLTSEVENFPGFTSILGADLIEKMRSQAKEFGTIIYDDNIVSVDFSKRPFTLSTSKTQYKSEAVIITAGAKALWLDLESEQRLRGRGVSACATCDGFFFRDKIVAVVGGGDTAMEETQTLTKFAKKVYLIHRRDTFRASKIMEQRIRKNSKVTLILNNEVTDVLGEQKVKAIQLKNPYEKSNTLAVDGLFVAIGHKPDTEVVSKALELDEKGYIITTQQAAVRLISGKVKMADVKKYNSKYQTMTSVAGVFAAGDCVDHIYRQASTAAGMGVAASLDAEKWLEE
ncbi:FAD-dependent oxidoreductase [Candidatus Woesebacteria bacterium]|nr:FAD-dependent oxidoreductase [Candidatus Woesebacteria bacterium]